MSRPTYAYRPSKDVTRKMLVHMLSRLAKIAPLEEYQYVGLGALEFIDFDLIHRTLSVKKMVSIEQDGNHQARYESNKPYQCIEVLYGHSTDMLTRIDWSGLSIVWMDYEDPLKDFVFDDIVYLCSQLPPGSALAVTLNAEPGRLVGRRERFASLVGDHRTPMDVDDDALGQWGWAEAQQRILFSTIRSVLVNRVDQASWRQIMNVNYRDDARMQLIAGVIETPAIAPLLDSCRFEAVDFYRPGREASVVEVPYLTPYEQAVLRRKLPRKPRQRLRLPGVEEEKVKNYASVYQWIGT